MVTENSAAVRRHDPAPRRERRRRRPDRVPQRAPRGHRCRAARQGGPAPLAGVDVDGRLRVRPSAARHDLWAGRRGRRERVSSRTPKRSFHWFANLIQQRGTQPEPRRAGYGKERRAPAVESVAMTEIPDVARELGMSTATVSRALRRLPRVSRDTRERVLEVANRIAGSRRLSTPPAWPAGRPTRSASSSPT